MRRVLALLALYVVAVVGLTWPYALEAKTRLPCAGLRVCADTIYSTWVLAWQAQALMTAPAQLANANIFHPTAQALFYGPAGFGALPFFAPVYWLTGEPALATNVLLLLGVAGSAAAVHWVVQRWTGSGAAGVVAAGALLSNRWLLWGFVALTPHWAPLFYFPVLAFLLARRDLSGRQWVAVLACVVLQSVVDPVYVAPAVFAAVGLLALGRLVRPASRRDGLRLVLLLVVAGLLLAPVYALYLGARAADPASARLSPWRGGLTSGIPSELSSVLSHMGLPTDLFPAMQVVLLAGVFAQVVRRLRGERTPADAPWAMVMLWVLVGVTISLKPNVVFMGQPIPVPHGWLADSTSFYSVVRVPQRLSVVALFGLVLGVGLGFAELVRWLPRVRLAWIAWPVATALAVVSAVEAPTTVRAIARSFPGSPMPSIPPAFIAALQASRGPLLHLPALDALGRPTPRLHAPAMYHSLFHGRPLLNGYSSYWPAAFMDRMKLADRLPLSGVVSQLVSETGLELVWVSYHGLTELQQRQWKAIARGHRADGLELVARSGLEALFRVNVSAPWAPP